MADDESALRYLILRDSEALKCVLHAYADYSTPSPPELVLDKHHKRTLAIVCHSDAMDGHEEGSVFVVKHRNSDTSNFDDLEIEHIFPITMSGFNISMSQIRRATLDLQEASTVLEPPRNALEVTMSVSKDSSNNSIPFIIVDIQSLKPFLAECKRLKSLNGTREQIPTALPSTFSWLVPYASKYNHYARFVDSPRDLRILHLPLSERLSDASAGMNGDEQEDLNIVKDDYIRRLARESSIKGKYRLGIRVGTFNVNGLPSSQDLSPWVRASTVKYSAVPSIPPLKKISPFDVDSNPLEHIGQSRTPTESNHNPPGSAFSSASIRGIAPSPSTSFFLSSPTSSSFTLNTDSSALSSLTLNDTDTIVADSDEADILVLAFQELDLSAEALLYSTTTSKEESWTTSVLAALGDRAEIYQKLISKQLVGMLIMVLVKKTLVSCFSDITTCSVGSGIMGVMGNKGGTAIRLAFTPPRPYSIPEFQHPGSTILTFVCSHLAAFDEMYERRNADFHDLSRRLIFDVPLPIHGNDALDVIPLTQKVNIFEADALFWMGDLNYRIDLPDVDVRSILSSDNWVDSFGILLEYDQLKAAMRSKKAFNVFTEYEITHKPTYRFAKGLLSDSLGYDLKRRPAWTDRILHVSSSDTAIVRQLSYNGHPEITQSDHRPVSADFSVEVDIYSHSACEAAGTRLVTQLLKAHESANTMNIKLTTSRVDFGLLKYKQNITRELRLKNVGQTPCAFRFLPLDSGSPSHPPWLNVEPLAGLIQPQENMYVRLTAQIGNTAAEILNLGPRELDGTLILHTITGKDSFISISGTFEYTSFANPLYRLIRLRGPVRNMSSPEDLLPANRAINAPREIMRLVNWMMSAQCSMDNVFIAAGDPDIVETIRECLDSGTDFPFSYDTDGPHIAIAFGDTLQSFLKSLSEPLIPYDVQERCIGAYNRDSAFEMLDLLSPAAVNVWISVTAFLHYIVSTSEDTYVKSQILASIFMPILFGNQAVYPPVSPVGKRQFILWFIQ